MNRLPNQRVEKQSTLFRSNPVLNRLNKVQDYAADEKSAAYGRITLKTAFFLLVTLAGMMTYLVLDSTVFANRTQLLEFEYRSFTVGASGIQLGFFIGAAVIAIISQLLAAFVQRSIPVTGTIYSFCQGFILAFLVFTVIKGYEYLGLLALAITVIVVFSMAMLYSTGAIKVTKKFYMVIFTLVAATVGIAILTLIGYLIPVTRPFVSLIMGNFWVSIAMTLLSIVIACLFLISDFAVIDRVVANKLPARYEWSAAFGLAFTVLWIYFKILDLLIRIVGRSKK